MCKYDVLFCYYFSRATRKRVFGHMRTAKAQISMRIPAVGSGHSYPLIDSLDNAECMNGEQRPAVT